MTTDIDALADEIVDKWLEEHDYQIRSEIAAALHRVRNETAKVDEEAERLLRAAAMELRKGQALPKDDRTDLAFMLIGCANKIAAIRSLKEKP